jgi:hypothetical protein
MSSLRDLALRRNYNNKKSVAACQALFEAPNSKKRLDAAFHSVLPILGIIIRKEFRNVDDFSVDDLIQVGAIAYWKLLTSKTHVPRPFDDRSHLNLYFKVGIRAMIKARPMIESEVCNFLTNNATPFTGVHNFQHPEQSIFVKELPVYVYDRVMTRVREASRFSEAEVDVCEYIARCVIFETDIVEIQARKLGGKNVDLEFFNDYISTLVKQAYYELKQEGNIHHMLGDEDAVYQHHFYYPTEQTKETC